MRRLFEITPRPDTVELQPNAQGRVVFTVTNVSDRPMRVRTLLQFGEKKPDEGWLTLEEPNVFDLEASSGTAEVAVAVQMPASASEGDYLFRLRAVSLENPDDDWTDSAIVTLRVKERQVAPATGKLPWAAIVGGAAVLAVAVGVAFFLAGPSAAKAGESCAELACVEDASCLEDRDGNKFCRIAEGQACAGHAECETLFCKEVCTKSQAGGACESNDDCALSQSCTDGGASGGAQLCRAKDGEPCSKDASCASLFCREGKTCAQMPALCQSNTDCYANHTCKAQMCLAHNGQPCEIGQSCLSGFCGTANKRRCRKAPSNCPRCRLNKVCDPSTGKCVGRHVSAAAINKAGLKAIQQAIRAAESARVKTGALPKLPTGIKPGGS